ncbi:MAG TPA: S-layer homology domain-containing protein [Armatimonadota bacterium]|jgi:hypothetical protein
MRKLIATFGAVAIVATVAHAQAPFADVPQDHWAYQAVNTLAQRGLVIGYPDGTFGGKRAMTRYEFAVVIARMIPQLETYIKDQVSAVKPGETPNLSNLATKDQLNGFVSKDDFDTLKKLVDQFTPELQMLQVDVAGVKKDLADLTRRVGILEDEVSRVKINGELNAIGRGTSTDRGSRNRGVSPLDLNGRSLNPSSNILERYQVLYDMDLALRAKVNKTVTANLLLNAGNYTGGFAAGTSVGPTPFPFPYGAATNGSNNAEITPWKAYISAPLSAGPLGKMDIEAGKTGVQFTPYTLKLQDYDAYTNITRTDNGDVVFTGLKSTFNLGKIGVVAYGGTHATQAAGGGFPLYVTANYTPRTQNPYAEWQLALFPGIPTTVAEITQSAGFHATMPTPLSGQLGLTFIEAALQNNQLVNNSTTPADRAQVYGADLKLKLFGKLGFAGEFSSSNLESRGKFKIDNETAFPRDLHNAYDGRLSLNAGGLAVTAGYRQVDPFFGAPGSWGALGSWQNPTNIKGIVTTAAYAFSSRLAVTGGFDDYRSVVRGYGANALETANDTKLQHVTAGLRYGLTSASRVDLGMEQVLYKDINPTYASANGDAKENYYNIGLGSDLGENTSLKLLYQIIDYKNHFLTNGEDAKGNVAVAQFQVKF